MSSPNYTYHHDRPTIWAGDTLPEIFFHILDDEDNAILFTEVCAEIRNRHGEVVWKYKPIYEADGRVGLPAVPSNQTLRMTDYLYTYNVSYKLEDNSVVSYLMGNVIVRTPYNRTGYGSGGSGGGGGFGNGTGSGSGNGGGSGSGSGGGVGGGLSAYEIALKNGFEGTEEEWLASLIGSNGLSAYEIAVKHGFKGTEKEWLESLQGTSLLVERHLSEIPEYDPNKMYRKGEIVRVDLTLYAAKKSVPRNNPPPSAEYWTNLGSFDSYLDILTSLVTTVDKNTGTIEQVAKIQAELSVGIQNLEKGLEGNASAISTLESRVKSNEAGIELTSKQVTELNSNLSIVQDDVRIIGSKVETKADSSAVSALDTKVEQQGREITAQSSSITKLDNSITQLGEYIDTKASNSALQELESTVKVQDDTITSQNKAITELNSSIEAIPNAGVNLAGYESAATLEPNGVELASLLMEQLEKGEGLTNTDTALKFTVTDVFEPAIIGYAKGTGQYAKVLPNAEYIISFYVFSPLDKRLQLFGLVSTTEDDPVWKNVYPITGSNRFPTVPAKQWVRVSIAVKTPRDAAALACSIYVNEDGHEVSDNNFVKLSRFMIERKLSGSLSPSSWTTGVTESVVVGNSNALNLLETEVKQQGDRITAQGQALTQLESDITDVVTVSIDGIEKILETKADSKALNELTTVVDKQGKDIVSQSNSLTELKSEIETSLGEVNGELEELAKTKAEASAVQSLETRVDKQEEGLEAATKYSLELNSKLTTTNEKVGDVQQAAQDAMELAGSRGEVIFSSTEPAKEKRLRQNLWIDTTDNANTPKRWNGIAWAPVSDKIAIEALEAANNALRILNTKADASALQELDTKVTGIDGRVTSQADALTKLTSTVNDMDRNVQGNAENISKLTVRTENTEKGIAAQAARSDKIELSISNLDKKKADASYVNDIEIALNEQGGVIEGHGKTLNSLKIDIDKNSSAISTEQQARVTADTALGNRIDSLTSTVGENTAAIKSEAKTRADADTALSSSIQSVSANVAANKAAITQESKARADADTALSKQVTEVSATLRTEIEEATKRTTVLDTRDTNQNPDWYWSNYPKTIVEEFKKATVLDLTGFGTYVNLETRVYYSDSTGGPIIQIAHAANNPANTMQRSSKSGTTWNAWGSIALEVDAAVKSEATARADADLALGERIDTVTASVDKNKADVSTVSNAVATLEGKVNAEWGVNLVANSKGQYVVAGIKAGVNNNSGVLQSAIIMQAQQFTIQDGANGAGTTPFQVVGGVVRMNAAVIGDATITMAKIGGDLYSTNFVSGVSGWRLARNGTLEFANQVAGQGKITLDAKGLRVFDSSNRLRVKVGDLR